MTGKIEAQIARQIKNCKKLLEEETRDKKEGKYALQIIDELAQWEDSVEGISIGYIEPFFSTLSIGYHYSGNNDKAISIINRGIDQLGRRFRDYRGKRQYFPNMGELYYKLGLYCAVKTASNRKMMGDAFRNHVYYELLAAAQSSHNFEFYSFYSPTDYHIDDLSHYQMALSNPSTFNDPVDCPIFEWIEKLEEKMVEQWDPEVFSIIAEQRKKAYSAIRIRCFVRNKPLPSPMALFPRPSTPIPEYSNTLMWAHYASKHQGYCVKYVFPESFFNTIDEDRPVLFLAPVEYVSDMNVLRDITIQDAFFTKHESWSYEHEMRLIYFDKDETSDSYHKEPMLDGMITDVYFGVRCEDSDKRRIIEALKGRTVKYHQMEVDPEHLYRLEEVPIDPSTYER